MTNSLYQNIQALGNRIVTNLGKMGVSAEFADGGLTLADKILEINRFTDGLLLSADKDLDQSGNTIKFTALYLENGKTVSGKEVFFDGAYSTGVSRSMTASADNSVGKKYAITSLPDVNTYLDKDHSLLIYRDSYPRCRLVVDNSVFYQGTNFIMDNGVIKYTDSNNNQQSVDVSNYDTSVVYPMGSGLVITDYGVSITDDYGVATAQYTCSGAGKFDVQAISGSVVSTPYTVWDAPVYDGDNTPTSISWSKTNNAVVTDEVVSLIASVLNTNNNPCINIPVTFKQGNTVLGTARTDVYGDATITYTWADSDIFDVTALVSQNLSEDLTMFVKDNSLDYLFYDIGTTSNHNENYVSGVQVNYTPDGEILTNNLSGNKYYLCNLNEASSDTRDTYDFQSPLKIEFEVLELKGLASVYCANNSSPVGTDHQNIVSTGKFSKTITLSGDLSIGFKLRYGSSLMFKNLILIAQ